ncbi:MAG: hypothetical protein ACLPKE_12870 [Streptosporangiaceae bacterium]
MNAASEGDLPLLESEQTDNHVTMHHWREIATEQGLDTETFPLPFEQLVDALLKNIAEEALRTAVDGDGNHLFPAVAAAHLSDLRRSVRILARTIEPDGQLGDALRATYEACRDRDRELFTPDVLLALLHLTDGSVAACFEAVRPGLSLKIAGSLRRFRNTPVASFRPFKWVERAEMRQAQMYAWVHGVPLVSGPLLLLGIIDSPSKTRDSLIANLGEGAAVMRQVAMSRISPAAQQPTPTINFDTE